MDSIDHAEKTVRGIVARHAHLEGPLLPILHDVQSEFGCVPPHAVPVIAEALNLSRAEVHGVVTFYHDFRRDPAGKHHVKLCRAEACQAVGGTAVGATLLKRFGVDWNGTSADGHVTVSQVFCLGLCSVAPAAMVDGTLRGRVDAETLVAELEGDR